MQPNLGEARPTTDGSSTVALAQGKKMKPGFRLNGLRSKLIVPYVLLTLILAMTGTYIVTRLVTASIRERFLNQSLEANRIAADVVVRRERFHLENLRLMAFTEGVAEAFASEDAGTLKNLLMPLAMNSQTEVVSAVDLNGREILTLSLDPSTGQYTVSSGGSFTDFEPYIYVRGGVVDETGDKFVGMHTTVQGEALLTLAPVKDDTNRLVGVLMAGTYATSLLDEIRSQALADVILLDKQRALIATTLPEPEEWFQKLAFPSQNLSAVVSSTREVSIFQRPYQMVSAPWIVRSQNLGWLVTFLPGNYVVDTEATSRNSFIILFALGTLAIVLVGRWIAQDIARPILRLANVSQAVASGDLEQETGLTRSDEIGQLAESFDQMTVKLRERTAEASRLYDEAKQRNQELAAINLRLQETQLQLVQSEKLAAIGQLTAGIVHDVKNPLAVIKGMAEVLSGDPEIPEELKKELQIIGDSAAKANRIVTDLLKFARQTDSEMRAQDLRETVETSLRLTAYLIRQAFIQLDVDLPERPLIARYDSLQIEQVLVNLIHNGIQAMEKYGKMQVRLEQLDGMAVISIQDNGSGIPEENLKRIFDPFFTTKPAGEGTGLGLSVSYGIIANHKGRINVESALGEGTTFSIWLPVKEEANIVMEAVQ